MCICFESWIKTLLKVFKAFWNMNNKLYCFYLQSAFLWCHIFIARIFIKNKPSTKLLWKAFSGHNFSQKFSWFERCRWSFPKSCANDTFSSLHCCDCQPQHGHPYDPKCDEGNENVSHRNAVPLFRVQHATNDRFGGYRFSGNDRLVKTVKFKLVEKTNDLEENEL